MSTDIQIAIINYQDKIYLKARFNFNKSIMTLHLHQLNGFAIIYQIFKKFFLSGNHNIIVAKKNGLNQAQSHFLTKYILLSKTQASIVKDNKLNEQNLIYFFESYQTYNNMMANSRKSLANLLVFVVIVLNLASTHSQTFTAEEMNTVLNAIDSYFFLPNATYKVEIRKFLRGAFHDCMGGCDGSINLNITDNRGLQNYAKTLSEAYNASIKPGDPNSAFFKRLTRADFFALSQTRALAWGILKSKSAKLHFVQVPFVYGRPSSPLYDRNPTQAPLPDAAGGWSAMLKVFKKGIPSLTEEDIVALLGLHGSGATDINNSGFNGPWGAPSDLNVVNNNFFINLLNLGFPSAKMSQVKASESNFPVINDPNIPRFSPAPPNNLIEWIRTKGPSNPAMMLPIDMQIYLKFKTNSTGYQDQGEYCPQGNARTLTECTMFNTRKKKYLHLAKNAPLAFAFAKNNPDYLVALISAFLKMVSYTSGTATLTPFTPQWRCINGAAVCLGDILFAGCRKPAISC